MAEFAYNESVNHSTGISPFEAVIGVCPRLLIDLVPLRLTYQKRDLVLKRIISSNTFNRYMMKFDAISLLAMIVTRLVRTRSLFHRVF